MLNFIFKFLKEYSKFPITLYVYPSFHQIPSHSIETTFQHFYHANRHNSDELLRDKVVEKIPFSLSLSRRRIATIDPRNQFFAYKLERDPLSLYPEYRETNHDHPSA